MHWKAGRYPPPGRPACAQPLCPCRQVPASMAFVTDSNRPQPLWQPPPTACLTASGTAFEVLSLLMHPLGGGGVTAPFRITKAWCPSPAIGRVVGSRECPPAARDRCCCLGPSDPLGTWGRGVHRGVPAHSRGRGLWDLFQVGATQLRRGAWAPVLWARPGPWRQGLRSPWP